MFMQRKWERAKLENCDGSSLVELALVIPVCLLLFVGAVDLGQAFYVAAQVAAAAHTGALYGVENPSDISGMESAAKGGATNLSDISATATYGCECSDGSSASQSCSTMPTCSYNYVTYVDVVASASYSPSFNYPWLSSAMTFSREARMRTGGD
jgi:Flp pilus assembly protein TadG